MMRSSTRKIFGNLRGSSARSGRPTPLSSAFSTEKEYGDFPGRMRVPFQNDFGFVRPSDEGVIPCYRVLDSDGNFVEGSDMSDEDLDRESALKMYTTMVKLQTMDQIFYDAQRQGRISFYMQSAGEESLSIGSAAALSPADMIFAQYREAGVLMYRGFSMQEFADQCFANEGDCSGGRQMPVHYGSRVLNYQTISSPLATQMPQATGAAYAAKLAEEDRIVVCYFGEGAASEGDFHASLNFAATLDVPIVFFCRNNGYAISTRSDEQYRGDGIAVRGLAYGMPVVRVDGNDIIAVRRATAEARALCAEKNQPVVVEAMSYRAGHHSTSDDSTRYRSADEIKMWMRDRCPVQRFRRYLERVGWWDQDREENLRANERAEVMDAIMTAEKKDKPEPTTMFDDVYAELPPHLAAQKSAMFAHTKKYPDHYNINDDAH